MIVCAEVATLITPEIVEATEESLDHSRQIPIRRMARQYLQQTEMAIAKIKQQACQK
jgi:hypothetical protein